MALRELGAGLVALRELGAAGWRRATSGNTADAAWQYCHRLALCHPAHAKLRPGLRSSLRAGAARAGQAGRYVRRSERARPVPIDPAFAGRGRLGFAPLTDVDVMSRARQVMNTSPIRGERGSVPGARAGGNTAQAVSAVLPEVARRASSRARVARDTRLALDSPRGISWREDVARGRTQRAR